MTKPPLVSQPGYAPTNKLTVGSLMAAAATEAWGEIMASVYPPLSGPAMSMLVGALVGLAVGYLVKDRANVDLGHMGPG